MRAWVVDDAHSSPHLGISNDALKTLLGFKTWVTSVSPSCCADAPVKFLNPGTIYSVIFVCPMAWLNERNGLVDEYVV